MLITTHQIYVLIYSILKVRVEGFRMGLSILQGNNLERLSVHILEINGLSNLRMKQIKFHIGSSLFQRYCLNLMALCLLSSLFMGCKKKTCEADTKKHIDQQINAARIASESGNKNLERNIFLSLFNSNESVYRIESILVNIIIAYKEVNQYDSVDFYCAIADSLLKEGVLKKDNLELLIRVSENHIIRGTRSVDSIIQDLKRIPVRDDNASNRCQLLNMLAYAYQMKGDLEMAYQPSADGLNCVKLNAEEGIEQGRKYLIYLTQHCNLLILMDDKKEELYLSLLEARQLAEALKDTIILIQLNNLSANLSAQYYNYNEAYKYYNSSLQLVINNPRFYESAILVHINYCQLLMTQDSFEKCLQHSKEVIRLANLMDVPGYLEYGNMFHSIGQVSTGNFEKQYINDLLSNLNSPNTYLTVRRTSLNALNHYYKARNEFSQFQQVIEQQLCQYPELLEGAGSLEINHLLLTNQLYKRNLDSAATLFQDILAFQAKENDQLLSSLNTFYQYKLDNAVKSQKLLQQLTVDKLKSRQILKFQIAVGLLATSLLLSIIFGREFKRLAKKLKRLKEESENIAFQNMLQANAEEARANHWQELPHVIKSMIGHIPVQKLNQFVEFLFRNLVKTEINLIDEIALVDKYFEIMAPNVVFEYPKEDYYSVKIPPISLLSLAINSQVHGRLGSSENPIFAVEIKAITPNQLRIIVKNNGKLEEANSGSGTGLKNLADRISYFNGFRTSVEREIDKLRGWYKVQFSIKYVN